MLSYKKTYEKCLSIMEYVLSGMQKERLAHIEFLALFMGKVSRKDIMERFDISQAAATRDLSLYLDIAPKNLIYSPKLRHYVASDSFKTHLNISASKCLNTLATGFGNYISQINPHMAFVDSLYEPDLQTTVTLTKAIHQKKVVSIDYSSKNGQSVREFCPFILISNGLRWHVRGFDRSKNEFRDFVINRINSITLLDQMSMPHEHPQQDRDWQDEIELELQVHPSQVNNKGMLEKEYQMENGVLKKRVKKAVAGYLLNSWKVDASIDASNVRKDILLHLKNAESISKLGISNLFLALDY